MRAPWRTVGTMLGTAALLVAALAVQAAYPTYEERFRPIATDGAVGQQVVTRDLEIRVTRVELARSITQTALDPYRNIEVRVDGVFLVVRATVTSRREPILVSQTGAYLRAADGTRTVSTDRVSFIEATDAATGEVASALQPLIPLDVTYVFEIPRSRLVGAQLWVSAEPIEWVHDTQAEDWFRAQARVDLGLDERRVAALLASAVRNYEVDQ